MRARNPAPGPRAQKDERAGRRGDRAHRDYQNAVRNDLCQLRNLAVRARPADQLKRAIERTEKAESQDSGHHDERDGEGRRGDGDLRANGRDPRHAHGLRWAEIVCGALQAASRWLQQEGLIEPGEGEQARGWKATLNAEWAEITTQPIRAPAKPRYSVTELRKLWGALPKADPRLALAVELGAELRLGPVGRSRRSDVLHSPDGRFEVGMVRVHGRGRKHGELLMLSMEEPHALTRTMTRGYLADLERAYRAGEIRDYYLFPGRRLTATRRKIRPYPKREETL